jgi:hypothetical protein
MEKIIWKERFSVGVKKIDEHAGVEAAKRIAAGVVFEVTEIRPVVAMR